MSNCIINLQWVEISSSVSQSVVAQWSFLCGAGASNPIVAGGRRYIVLYLPYNYICIYDRLRYYLFGLLQLLPEKLSWLYFTQLLAIFEYLLYGQFLATSKVRDNIYLLSLNVTLSRKYE